MFAKGMTVDFLFVLFIGLSVVLVLRRSKTHPSSYQIRKISGLDAIDEGIGRATEMSRPVFYMPGGVGDVIDPQTLASMDVLSEVAKITARYDTRLIVPLRRAYLVPIMSEVVRQAYASEGKQDSFRPEQIRWYADDGPAFASGAVELMFREKVATTVILGDFSFDALVFAEAGNQAGAIQIGGTATINQIPFLVAACDYSIIGEEIYAAAAYLTKDPARITALVVEDWVKYILTGLILLGAAMKTAGVVGSLTKLIDM